MFTFEIVRHGEAPVITDVLRLPDERAIWCRAEGLALRIENTDSAFIRVKNSEDATVVRTGVTTALLSIEKCSCVACPSNITPESDVMRPPSKAAVIFLRPTAGNENGRRLSSIMAGVASMRWREGSV